MSRSSLLKAFLTAVLIHLAALTAVSLLWGPFNVSAPQSHPIPADWVVVESIPQRVTFSEPEEIMPPALESLPLPPTVQEPISPPKKVEQKRVAPPQKHPATKNVSRVKPPTPARMDDGPPGLPSALDASSQAQPKPGPPLPLPDESAEGPAGNVLGPSPLAKTEDISRTPVEGGEAGAGNLFDKGDATVIPGPGVGGGSGGPGRAGLGRGADGGGTHVGGMRPGSGGQGPGEGLDGSSGPRGGYQVKPRYPDAARRRGVEGTVLLKARVTEQGRVDEVQIENSAGHPELDHAAIEALRRWRFDPARRGRDPVAVWVMIPFQFKLR